MRARNIKPGFFQNDQLAECSIPARYLFSGLWGYADREGRMQDRPKRIKAEIMPYDDVDINALLGELAAMEDFDGEPAFIRRYVVDGKAIIQIENFLQHQRPHPKEAPSKLPAYDKNNTKVCTRQHLGVTKTTPRCDLDNTKVCTSREKVLHDPSDIRDLDIMDLDIRDQNIKQENGAEAAPCVSDSEPSKPNPENEALECLVSDWNAFADKHKQIAKVTRLSPSQRRSMAIARLKDRYFRENYHRAFPVLEASDFHMGKNDSNWAATFEYFVRPGTLDKLLERGETSQSRDRSETRPEDMPGAFVL